MKTINFNSYNELLNSIDYLPPCSTKNFYDSKSIEEAKEKALNYKNIEVEDVLDNDLKSLSKTNSVCGSVVNMGAYVVGNPVNMIRKKTVKTDYKLLDVSFNMSIRYQIPYQQINKFGVNLSKAILKLEKSGYRCSIKANIKVRIEQRKGKGSRTFSDFVLISIHIKEYEDNVNYYEIINCTSSDSYRIFMLNNTEKFYPFKDYGWFCSKIENSINISECLTDNTDQLIEKILKLNN